MNVLMWDMAAVSPGLPCTRLSLWSNSPKPPQTGSRQQRTLFQCPFKFVHSEFQPCQEYPIQHRPPPKPVRTKEEQEAPARRRPLAHLVHLPAGIRSPCQVVVSPFKFLCQGIHCPQVQSSLDSTFVLDLLRPPRFYWEKAGIYM